MKQATKKCPHIKGTVKWGIASSKKWCPKCKMFVHLEIDWSGHP